MSLASLPPTWQGWIASLQTPLHQRLAWRLEPLMLGVVMAKGRRTITSWLRAAGLRTGWEDYYYFLSAVGRVCEFMAMLLLRLLVRNLLPEGPLVFAIDDTPTKRYGPKVEGAGLHHNPTPGPAGQKLLYGHLWVTLAWIVRHPLWGAIGLPLPCPTLCSPGRCPDVGPAPPLAVSDQAGVGQTIGGLDSRGNAWFFWAGRCGS